MADDAGTADVDSDDPYVMFPPGAESGFGPTQGYNAIVRLNNPDLFTDAARKDPVIDAFLIAVAQDAEHARDEPGTVALSTQ